MPGEKGKKHPEVEIVSLQVIVHLRLFKTHSPLA